MFSMPSDSEIVDLLRRAKYVAINHGYPQLADDFSQEAYIRLAGGRKATLDQLFVDFLRQEYGDTRTSWGRIKSREAHHRNAVSAEDDRFQCGVSAGGNEEPVGSSWRARIGLQGRDALIYDLLVEEEMSHIRIADLIGITESRISQIVKSCIKPALEKAWLLSEYFDEYHDDQDASKLQVDWIRI